MEEEEEFNYISEEESIRETEHLINVVSFYSILGIFSFFFIMVIIVIIMQSCSYKRRQIGREYILLPIGPMPGCMRMFSPNNRKYQNSLEHHYPTNTNPHIAMNTVNCTIPSDQQNMNYCAYEIQDIGKTNLKDSYDFENTSSDNQYYYHNVIYHPGSN